MFRVARSDGIDSWRGESREETLGPGKHLGYFVRAPVLPRTVHGDPGSRDAAPLMIGHAAPELFAVGHGKVEFDARGQCGEFAVCVLGVRHGDRDERVLGQVGNGQEPLVVAAT